MQWAQQLLREADRSTKAFCLSQSFYCLAFAFGFGFAFFWFCCCFLVCF